MGIRVTLLRETTIGLPIVRFFEDATNWSFADGHPGAILRIMKRKIADGTAVLAFGDLLTIAEFSADGIESVELDSKETA